MLNESLPMPSDDFLSDLVSGRKDILALGVDHELSERMLSQWIQSATNVQFLAGLIRLADMQTQLLISRYRSHAVTRLASIVSDDKEKTETARRASVDLLKLDLRGAMVDDQLLIEDEAIRIPTPEDFYGDMEEPTYPSTICERKPSDSTQRGEEK